MRGSVPGLRTPYPAGSLLPGYLAEDQFATRWVRGFDDVLAPVISVLDCLDAYVDPLLSPADFTLWLAGWVGAVVDENWAADRQRLAIRRAVALHQARGTVSGLRDLLELATGGSVELADGGGVTWSATPLADLAPADQRLQIRVTVSDPATVSLAALESIIKSAKPAHLPHTIEVVGK